ncbi:MAG TPA: acetyl-CoA hydrolase/transferase C-terminal domain-containing protein [Amycolatopsis sp.]|nr:acetyl-CoA hydrolase/transferase C-terminal domain-containing protein [Amycolatopsis sp.]
MGLDAAEALSVIPPRAHIVAGPGCGAPAGLLSALANVAPGRDWTLSSGLLLGDYPFLDLVRDGALGYRTWHVMGPVRGLVADGTVDFVPVRASRLVGQLAVRGVDAALVRVTPPDRHGYCSVGPSASYSLDAMRLAKIRIGEVDPALPWTQGRTTVPASLFDALIEAEVPTPSYVSATPDASSRRIAEHILKLLPRDPTLQIGIGAIPESVVGSLADAGLGRVRFAGMATDEMVDLAEAGVLDTDGETAAILAPELMGSARLMAFSDRNPMVAVYPSSTAHDAEFLGGFDRFVSINTAIEVDLTGHVNSEVVKARQVSGIGGSLDFIDAATRSVGGLRIIALPSTAAGGAVSRIVPAIGASGTVTIPRSLVDVIVTEYGAARLDGLSTRERADALIAIAHPDHRAALAEGTR